MKFKMAEKSLFAILLRSPWWISFAIAVAFGLASKALLPAQYFVFGALGGLPFVVIGVIAAWRQFSAPSTAHVEGTLAQLTPKHFLYEEVIMGLARMQELQKELPLALDTYRRLLKERPESRRADEIRSRIAMLEGAQRRQ